MVAVLAILSVGVLDSTVRVLSEPMVTVTPLPAAVPVIVTVFNVYVPFVANVSSAVETVTLLSVAANVTSAFSIVISSPEAGANTTVAFAVPEAGAAVDKSPLKEISNVWLAVPAVIFVPEAIVAVLSISSVGVASVTVISNASILSAPMDKVTIYFPFSNVTAAFEPSPAFNTSFTADCTQAVFASWSL